MSQSFNPIDPVKLTLPGTGWRDVDVSAYVPAGATGIILHFRSTSSAYVATARYNGSTDTYNEAPNIAAGMHYWTMVGVDANRIVEINVSNTTYMEVYLCGYTTAGVTFFVNGIDKSLGTTGAWTDVDCSANATGATGLIFHVKPAGGTTDYAWGLRCNGSTDNRTGKTRFQVGADIIGCDAGQVVEGYIANSGQDLYLIGYVTSGTIFNVNATDVSLGLTGAYYDLAALPAGSVMGFIEINVSVNYNVALRINGSSEDIYRPLSYHGWAFIGCDASYIIEGKIANVAVDFFVVGYAIAITGGTVETDAASNIGYTTVTLNGELTGLGAGDTSVVVSFEYGLDTNYGSSAAASESPLTEPGTFHADITGLSDGQTYHFRVKAVGDASGTAYGDDMMVTLDTFEAPNMVTVTPSFIGQSIATLVGNISSVNGINATRRGFVLSTDENFATYDLVYEDGDFGEGVYSLSTENFLDLLAGTKYYVKSFAINREGTGEGLSQSFDTLPGYPINETEPIDDDTLIYNEASITIKNEDGDTEEIAIRDETLQLSQGPRVLSRKDSVIANRSDAAAQAYIIVKKYSDSILRMGSALIKPDAQPGDLYPAVLGYDLSTRLLFQVNSTRNPANLNQQYHIEGIEHEWDSKEDEWRTRWQLWDVSKFRICRLAHEGWVRNFGANTYATIHDGASGVTPVHNDEGSIFVGQREVLSAFYIDRGLIQIDTSNVPTGKILKSAALIFHAQTDTYNNTVNFTISLVSAGGLTSPIDLSAFGTLKASTTKYASQEFPSGVLPKSMIIMELNAAGLAQVVAGGQTYFGIRQDRDIDADEPLGALQPKYEYIKIDGLGTLSPPILVVEVE